MAVRDHDATETGTLKPALVDKATRPDPLNLFEDSPHAGLCIQRGGATLASQVGFHDFAYPARIARRKLERGKKYHIVTDMKDGVVVAKVKVFSTNGLDLVFFGKRSADSSTSSMNIVRSRAGGGARKCRFYQSTPPTVDGMPNVML